MSLMRPFRIAISADFLKAFSEIPQKQQAKVREFVEKFRTDPTSPGINYEKIQQSIDPHLRSVRIDQNYRGIILKPEVGNAYVLLWVDTHDEAYRWASNRRVAINPETGSLQVFQVEESRVTETTPFKENRSNALFRNVSAKEFRKLGVPDDLLSIVGALTSEDELDQVAAKLPQEATEGLYMVAAGYSIEEALMELEHKVSEVTVDTTNFNTALDNPDSRRRFYVVDDAVELAEILNAPLEQWRVFLHPSQRAIVEIDANGPIKVLGGAGTGKTVVAMHRAKYLAQKIFSGNNDRILFTTFTKNLAADILENLRTICTAETLKRIEVVNLDAWVSQFLSKHGYTHTVVFESETASLWDAAMNEADPTLGLSSEFYRSEWQQVIQANGISSLEEYLRVPRIGRGKSLSRIERQSAWKVFEGYRAELNRKGFKELTDAVRDARLLLNKLGDILPYRTVIVDEAQDMGTEAFKLLRAIIPPQRIQLKNDLFIVGDAHQRIYGHRVVLSKCGIETRGRSRKLRINYRTTDETQKWATAILLGKTIDDLDGGNDSNKGYTSLLHGDKPVLRTFPSFSEETKAIIETVKELQARNVEFKNICLIARTNDLVLQYEGALRASGMDTYRIQRSESENRKQNGIRLATMHRVKGIEFDYVIIAGVNDGIVPLSQSLQSANDVTEREERELNERSLLYVSATRAKKSVFVTSFGYSSEFIK
jgi:superfamily I DNA/RNA helicase/mRNA-degrading endonuclease RelE of RelBE toxin-antitoxin system